MNSSFRPYPVRETVIHLPRRKDKRVVPQYYYVHRLGSTVSTTFLTIRAVG